MIFVQKILERIFLGLQLVLAGMAGLSIIIEIYNLVVYYELGYVTARPVALFILLNLIFMFSTIKKPIIFAVQLFSAIASSFLFLYPAPFHPIVLYIGLMYIFYGMLMFNPLVIARYYSSINFIYIFILTIFFTIAIYLTTYLILET
jgi:hypothetical protein